MVWLLGLVAVVALGAMLFAWRVGRGWQVLAGLALVVVGAGAGAGWLAATERHGPKGEAGELLAESAVAFNRMPDAGVPGPNAAAGSLPELADRLAARLQASPDDAAGWSLLAATYRQLGRDEDAAEAERRAIEAGGDPSAFAGQHSDMMRMPGGGGSLLAAATQGSPAAARHVAEGQRLRIDRKFAEAEAAFRKAVEADPMDADSWADLADCAAMAAGRDMRVGREAIEQALKINPQHRKALWLRATLELQEEKYQQAAATWRTLAGLVAPDSPDARVIAANIAEADMRASRPGQEG